jgi:predicted GTPase
VVVGNKSHKEHKINIEEMTDFCATGNYPFFLTSAERGDGVPALCEAVAVIIQEKEEAIARPVETVLDDLRELPKENGASSCNC